MQVATTHRNGAHSGKICEKNELKRVQSGEIGDKERMYILTGYLKTKTFGSFASLF